MQLFHIFLGVLASHQLCHAFLAVPSPARCSAFLPANDVKTLSAPASRGGNMALNMAYKNVFVAGGSKGVGRLVIDKLLASGSQVKAMVRSKEVANELNVIDGVTAVVGDAFEQKTVENAMDGCDACITTLGGSTQDRRVDYEGNANVIESAGILGIQRVILVTSVGCGNSKEAAPPSVFEVLKVREVSSIDLYYVTNAFQHYILTISLLLYPTKRTY